MDSIKRNLRELDLVGQRFGELTVLKKLRKNGNIYLECQCSCGVIKEIRQSHLLSGATSSCGCARIVDLVGQRFGKLLVIAKGRRIKSGSHLWLCKCDCGGEIEAQAGHLRDGDTTSCGCNRVVDITGQRFGKLVVLSKVESSYGIGGDGTFKWRCKCDCGNELEVRAGDLKNGHTSSCGCYLIEQISTHGLSKDPLYKRWRGIIQRCYNKSHESYHNYGGRGIILCAEWHNFKTFYEWASVGYSPELEIDRIDNNGPYSPENCRRVSRKENARNTRYNVNITLRGVTQCASAWAEKLEIDVSTLLNRIKKGWSEDKILNTPVRKNNV
jgi:hypothetical protein